MKSLVLNLVLAVIWLFLNPEPSLSTFFIGLILGFALLAAFHSVHNSLDYIRRTLAFFRYLLVFTKEFLVANLLVLRAVLFQKNEELYPNFMTYDVTGLSDLEIMLMYYCISLTPGSAAVSLTDDKRTMIIHVFDARDPDEVRRQLDTILKAGILAFTR
ncbi:MAG TPA: Na+/H+ antiporter subunit E [Chthoniobacteraceae bacterium]|nr:Na+/H+ antiporter subunit E [Chthoniobacteraceae bacterium]